MKLSLDWIAEFVDLSGIDPAEIAEKLTVHTAEVDAVTELSRSVRNVQVARVLSVREVSAASRTRVAQIDTGSGLLEVLCGAINLREGMISLFAMPGATLADGKLVEPMEIHGIKSVGMLCSAAELGFGYGGEGIVELPPNTPTGQQLSVLIASRDTILEIDNKSITNRPDLWGHYGFAREIAAIFGRPLRPLEISDVHLFSNLPSVELLIDSEDCLFYSAIRFHAGLQRPSPLVMQGRLGAIGSRPRNLLVDVTNYVQFEMGQPTHAFDADKISRIVVANSSRSEEFTTLDGLIRKIVPGDLLIRDGDTPVALAGIMGGGSSEVTPETSSVLLESANFRGSRIRTTSVRLGLRTDASQRFEKKLPTVYAPQATARILRLLESAGAQPSVLSSYSVAGTVEKASRIIGIPAGYISSRAGTEISDEESKKILDAIGFETTVQPEGGLEVAVPPFRSVFDVSTLEDLSEEILRLYGYDKIRPSLPAAVIDSVPLNSIVCNHHRARRILAQSYDFVELITYSWYSEIWLQRIGYTPARRTLDLRNPIGADRARLRESIMPNLLAAAKQNSSESSIFRIFEAGRIFWLDADGKKQEANELCGLLLEQNRAASAAELFSSARAILEDIAALAHVGPLRTRPARDVSAPWKRTSATVEILAGEKTVGTMGIIPSSLCAEVGGSNIAWFTLEIDSFAGEVYQAKRYSLPPVFPGSTQDFTFVPPSGVNHADMEAILDRLNANVSWQRSFVTVYRKNHGTDRYTFRFHIFHADRTLTSDDIADFREMLVRHVEANGVRLLDSEK